MDDPDWRSTGRRAGACDSLRADGGRSPGSDPENERRSGGDPTAGDPDFVARLHAGGVTFDREDATLLRAVDRTGSLNAAADDLGRSYSRAHDRLYDLEAAFGDLLERRRGGPDGGGSRLTDRARGLLTRFERLRVDLAGAAGVAEWVLPGEVRERRGEMGLVDTPAGDLRALVPAADDAADADAVELSVRADAVTLHAPDRAPAADATSARNRLRGEVASVDPGEAVARVRVAVGAPDPLVALVTRDSLDRLELAPGDRATATFKATATRAVPRE